MNGMSQEFHATYESGVLRLDEPLAIPEQARVSGVVSLVAAQATLPQLTSEPPDLSRRQPVQLPVWDLGISGVVRREDYYNDAV